MNNQYHAELEENSDRNAQFLEERIYEHNANAIGKHDGRLFSVIVKDSSQNIVAGIAGWTWAGICEITNLWVSESERRNGIGKSLLEKAEAHAKSKGCAKILVRSYLFQAPYFYKRHGFNVEHVLNDFPVGHSYFFLVKTLH
jgi:ribosomal protein S18 acetylase RimI-like enzyme